MIKKILPSSIWRLGDVVANIALTENAGHEIAGQNSIRPT